MKSTAKPLEAKIKVTLGATLARLEDIPRELSPAVSPCVSAIEDIIVPREALSHSHRLLHDVKLLYPEHQCCHGHQTDEHSHQVDEIYDLAAVDSARTRIYDAHKPEHTPTLTHDFHHTVGSADGHDNSEWERVTCACSCCGAENSQDEFGEFDDDDEDYDDNNYDRRFERRRSVRNRVNAADINERNQSQWAAENTHRWVQTSRASNHSDQKTTTGSVRTHTKSIPDRRHMIHDLHQPSRLSHNIRQRKSSMKSRQSAGNSHYYQDVFDAVNAKSGRQSMGHSDNRVPTITEWNEFYERGLNDLNSAMRLAKNMPMVQDGISENRLFNWLGRLIWSASGNEERMAAMSHREPNNRSRDRHERDHHTAFDVKSEQFDNDLYARDDNRDDDSNDKDLGSEHTPPCARNKLMSVDFLADDDTVINSSADVLDGQVFRRKREQINRISENSKSKKKSILNNNRRKSSNIIPAVTRSVCNQRTRSSGTLDGAQCFTASENKSDWRPDQFEMPLQTEPPEKGARERLEIKVSRISDKFAEKNQMAYMAPIVQVALQPGYILNV